MAASSVSMPTGRPSPGSRRRLARFGDRLVLRQANFRELGAVAPEAGFGRVDGLLFDLGLSSYQLADARARLRLPDRRPARHALRHEPRRPGRRPPRHARRARARRPLPALRRGAVRRAGSPGRSSRPARTAPIETAEQLAALVERVVPAIPGSRRRIHPATRVFQALRIAVNEELDALEAGPRRRHGPAAAGRPARRPELPLAGGPHRQALHRGRAQGLHLPAGAARLRLRPQPAAAPLGPPSVTPSAAEVAANPRSRSARLRAAERLAA